MTVDRAVLNIAASDFMPGLTYVALSRVKTLAGLLFEEPFDFVRLKLHTKPKPIVKMREDDATRRVEQPLDEPLEVEEPLGMDATMDIDVELAPRLAALVKPAFELPERLAKRPRGYPP